MALQMKNITRGAAQQHARAMAPCKPSVARGASTAQPRESMQRLSNATVGQRRVESARRTIARAATAAPVAPKMQSPGQNVTQVISL